MRIVTWNCNGAFRKKFREIAFYDADVYVIQECEDPAQVDDAEFKGWSRNRLWTGKKNRKGLGIFANPQIQLEPLDWKSGRLEHFIPCRINSDFNLLGTWCHGAESRYSYIGQLWKYLQRHKRNLDKAIIAGDFNSNKFWDKKGRKWNHTEVVRILTKCRIESTYHKYFMEDQGREKQPTFYLYKKLSKPYHLDYIFASDDFNSPSVRVIVGEPDTWLHLSDHMPMVFEF
jgi:exonuclease III